MSATHFSVRMKPGQRRYVPAFEWLEARWALSSLSLNLPLKGEAVNDLSQQHVIHGANVFGSAEVTERAVLGSSLNLSAAHSELPRASQEYDTDDQAAYQTARLVPTLHQDEVRAEHASDGEPGESITGVAARLASGETERAGAARHDQDKTGVMLDQDKSQAKAPIRTNARLQTATIPSIVDGTTRTSPTDTGTVDANLDKIVGIGSDLAVSRSAAEVAVAKLNDVHDTEGSSFHREDLVPLSEFPALGPQVDGLIQDVVITRLNEMEAGLRGFLDGLEERCGRINPASRQFRSGAMGPGGGLFLHCP